ncbi:class E sortase [Streptomyces sp. NPDC087658]|uniref:class E sortase n=1 Tax=Streptomyces sp. NPDC087658 TaxID=3365800 RepID=UPI00380E6DDF
MYEQGGYEGGGTYEQGAGGPVDPLNGPPGDPLNGQPPAAEAPRQPPAQPARRPGRHRGVPRQETPVAYEPAPPPPPVPAQQEYYQRYAGQAPPQAPEAASRAEAAPRAPAGPVEPPPPYYGDARTAVLPPVPAAPVPPPISERDDRTVALRALDPALAPGRAPEAPPVTGGRAERRRAAKGGGRGRRRPGPTGGPEADPGPVEPTSMSSRPLSRVEARRAARLRKESPAVIASRVVGELFITFGVLMLLFVTYQLWWTNIQAGLYAGKETNKIQSSFTENREAGAFEPGQGFAVMHIPKLDVVVPVAEGIDKEKVLDRGMVGHYAEGGLKTAMPDDRRGNFAVAGHRNTHGEPFRYINRLKPGDKIIVETRDAYYTYDMTSILPQTPPSNVSVIEPVPVGSGFTGPGRYITLTTCTPEFTSTYRMIVWGKMVDERPRSKGKPDALVG